MWPWWRPPVRRPRRASSHLRSEPAFVRAAFARLYAMPMPGGASLSHIHMHMHITYAYGCSLYHIRLQPPSHMVAGGARPDQDAGAVGALGQVYGGAEDRAQGAREPAQGRLVDAGDATHTHVHVTRSPTP